MRIITIGLAVSTLIGSCVISGCGGSDKATPHTYTRATTMQVPGKPLAVFDISYVDAASGRLYVADRSNASVDIFDTRQNTYLGRISGFVGAQADRPSSGPNGVIVVGNQLWVGDGPVNGDSKVQVVDLTTNSIVNTISTGGVKRADEVAYDPQDNILMVANDADPVPFVTLISTSTQKVLGKISLPNATGGLDQPAWDPTSKMFYVSESTVGTAATGAIAQIDPKTLALVKELPVPCSPSGLTLGPNSHFLVGCNDPGKTLVIDTSGNLISTIAQVGGADEVWYNSGDNHYYVAASGNTGGGVLGIIDAGSNAWIANVSTDNDAHSVAADPSANEIFVPLPPKANDPACVNGCVGVYK